MLQTYSERKGKHKQKLLLLFVLREVDPADGDKCNFCIIHSHTIECKAIY